MSLIADASVSLCWFLPGQANPNASGILNRGTLDGMTVPELWHLELANRIGPGLRTGYLLGSDASDIYRQVQSMRITTVPLALTSPHTIVDVMSRFRLTACDAVYLQLAISTGLPLATFDKELITAAPLAGVALLP